MLINNREVDSYQCVIISCILHNKSIQKIDMEENDINEFIMVLTGNCALPEVLVNENEYTEGEYFCEVYDIKEKTLISGCMTLLGFRELEYINGIASYINEKV